MSSAAASAAQSGGFDVKPSDLYRVSAATAAQQDALHKGVTPFQQELEKYKEAGGAGSAAQEFAMAYRAVAERFFGVYAKSVVSIGGASLGFTTTANNYVKANAASDPKQQTTPATRPDPQVIRTVPSYDQVTPLSWNTSGDDDFISSVLDGIDTGFWAVFRELLQHACRWGPAADVMPLPNYVDLAEISFTWQMPMTTLGRVQGMLTQEVGTITDQSNSEWYSAMRAFCSSLWGTTAWGQSRVGYEWKHDSAAANGQSLPVFAVLQDTARGIQGAVHDYADTSYDLRNELRKIYNDAVLEAIPALKDGLDFGDIKSLAKSAVRAAGSLGTNITLNLDTAAMSTAVSKYDRRLAHHTLALKELLPALEEAAVSAPTFRAEAARAQAYGARSLNEFKTEHHYAVPGEDKDNHFFPIDLASQEGIHGSHPVDKHIGLTDTQLAQRLRDQNVDAASTFRDLESGQRLTQEVLDDTDNAVRVEEWIKSVEQKVQNRPNYNPDTSKIQPPLALDFGTETTGRTINSSDYATHGMSATAQDTHGVKVVLQYKSGLEPPFVVVTSMPTA